MMVRSMGPNARNLQNVLIAREMQSYNVHKRSFRGLIDDIRIYNRALSTAEVKALYDFEKP